MKYTPGAPARNNITEDLSIAFDGERIVLMFQASSTILTPEEWERAKDFVARVCPPSTGRRVADEIGDVASSLPVAISEFGQATVDYQRANQRLVRSNDRLHELQARLKEVVKLSGISGQQCECVCCGNKFMTSNPELNKTDTDKCQVWYAHRVACMRGDVGCTTATQCQMAKTLYSDANTIKRG